MSASKHGRLRLTIISAMGLDPNASMYCYAPLTLGPFVVLRTGDFKLAETEYKRHCGEPHWNKSYLVKLNDVATDELIFEVYSYHFLSRTEKIGVARLTNLESLERQIVKRTYKISSFDN
jgi:Ca2+-dependent lipid-binding protein